MEVPIEMAFHVDHLLNTNSTPSQVERNILQNFILQLDEDISHINEKILAMQSKILVLQTSRSQLLQQRKFYSRLLSPLRNLPIEIFGEIFMYATHDSPRHVLNLSAVCQLWRDAALRTPALWSTLELVNYSAQYNMDSHIDSWIKRAHSYPLSLVIRHHEASGFVNPVNAAIALLNNHKCRSITLEGDKSILSILKELRFANLDMLESFSLDPQFRCSQLSIPYSLRYAPKLKTLCLDISIPPAFHMLSFPWRQLTSLTILSMPDEIVVDILRACVNLEELIKDGDCDVLGSDDSITLNYLRKLHTLSTDNMILPSLRTPSIQDFAVKATDSTNIHGDYISQFIKKNGSTLLKLSIAPSDDLFVKVIPYLRSLVELRLYDNNCDGNGSSVINDILYNLVVKPEMDSSDIPLPRLEALEIICHATEYNQRIFMKVIGSRWWSDEEENVRQKQRERPLSRIKRSVLLNVDTELNVFCGDDVNLMREQGMNIDYLAPFDGMDKDDFYTFSYY